MFQKKSEKTSQKPFQNVLHFWFEEISPSQWWEKNTDFDQMLTQKFGVLHSSVVQGEQFDWRRSPKGRLAEIIVLDQFSRNIHRDTPQAFANDSMALVLAQEAIAHKVHKALSTVERNFLLLPYMHSESKKIHELALSLYEENGDPATLEFEKAHKAIIDNFGRYPHRNAILGRESSNSELEFLAQPNSSF